MIYLVSALYCEVSHLINALGLKKDMSVMGFEVFRSEHYTLSISRIGKLASAIATTHLCTRFPPKRGDFIVNIGICGARPETKAGSIFLINSIRDNATKRSFFPDVLLRHGLSEAALETFDFPVTKEDLLAPETRLVDMETFGWAEAALSFFSSHQLSCLKVVSDNLSAAKLSPRLVENIMQPHIPLLLDYFELLQRWGEQQQNIFAQDELEGLMQLAEQNVFTKSQRRLFFDLCQRYFLQKNESPLTRLVEFQKLTPLNTRERSATFARIKATLVSA